MALIVCLASAARPAPWTPEGCGLNSRIRHNGKHPRRNYATVPALHVKRLDWRGTKTEQKQMDHDPARAIPAGAASKSFVLRLLIGVRSKAC